jgi:subtilisin
MRTFVKALLCCSVLFSVLPNRAAERNSDGQTNRADGTKRYVVMLKRTVDQDRCVNEHAVKRSRIFRHAINGFVADLRLNAVERLRRDPRVQMVVEDRISATQCAQTIPTGVLRMGVNHFPPVKIDGTDKRVDVDVAVIDSGIQLDHPDLNVVQAVDVTGEGLVDTGNPHGTECAGILGAVDNSFGAVGVAPGVRLWSVRASVPGGFYTSDIISAFDYVAARADQICVVSCSFASFYGRIPSGLFEPSKQMEREAVIEVVNRGVVVVAAVGNDAGDIAGPDGILGNEDDSVPAAFPEVMAVSAMNPATDRLAAFSNFARSHHAAELVSSPGGAIDVAAPGERILTTSFGGSYVIGGGTSFACPHAAGVVALYIASYGRATNAAGVYRIRQAIVDAAQPQSEWQNTNTLDPDSFHEGLVFPSVSWLTNAPQFLSIASSCSNVDVKFTTLPGYTHTVQQAGPAMSGWTNLASTNGTGASATVHDSTELAAKFYRLTTHVIPWPPVGAFSTATNIGALGTNANGIYIATAPGVAGAIAGDSANPAVPLPGGASASRVKIPYLPALNPSGPFSVELWVKPAQTNDVQCPVASTQRVDSQWSGWAIYMFAQGFQLRCRGDSGTGILVGALANTFIETNSWYHLVGVYDGMNAILYVNGIAAATTPFPEGVILRPNPAAALEFGVSIDLSLPYSGDLDEAAIYTNALSAAQVLAHYQTGTNATPPIPYSQLILNDNPAGYWRFDEQ